jgi:hypothetical protein
MRKVSIGDADAVKLEGLCHDQYSMRAADGSYMLKRP